MIYPLNVQVGEGSFGESVFSSAEKDDVAKEQTKTQRQVPVEDAARAKGDSGVVLFQRGVILCQ